MRKRGGAPLPILGALLFALALPTSPLRAQSDPRLVDALRAAQEGRGDSARAAVQRLLAATSPTDTLYAEILYTQAMVAGEAAEMRHALQRVAVEHPTSSWADDALLRLVQIDYASRNLDGAARNLEKLRQDFALTPLLPQAAYWAARTYFDLKNPALACRWLSDGMARVQNNLELQNQLGYLYQRCDVAVADSGAAGQRGGGADTTADTSSARPPLPGDTAAKDAPDTTSPGPAAPRPRFRVQVSAVATPGAADDAADKVEALGFPAVIIRERGLYKVRAGAFSTRDEALAAARKLKARLGGSPFVVAEP